MRVCHTFVFIVNDCVLDNLQSLCGNLSSYLGFFFQVQNSFLYFFKSRTVSSRPGRTLDLGLIPSPAGGLAADGCWDRAAATPAVPNASSITGNLNLPAVSLCLDVPFAQNDVQPPAQAASLLIRIFLPVKTQDFGLACICVCALQLAVMWQALK